MEPRFYKKNFRLNIVKTWLHRWIHIFLQNILFYFSKTWIHRWSNIFTVFELGICLYKNGSIDGAMFLRNYVPRKSCTKNIDSSMKQCFLRNSA